MIETKKIDILLVEDSRDDILIAEEAFEKSELINKKLHVVRDGVEALKFLRGEGTYVQAPRPHLILLDLNLPGKSGMEVLEEIKRDEALMAIPVIVFSTSRAEEDVVNSYRLHANCYISKPFDFRRLVEVVRAIDQFWFSVVTLPERAG